MNQHKERDAREDGWEGIDDWNGFDEEYNGFINLGSGI